MRYGVAFARRAANVEEKSRISFCPYPVFTYILNYCQLQGIPSGR